MDGARHFVRAEHLDGALDLAPVAEMDDVAERTAAVGARGRLHLRKLAEILDQVGRAAEGCPVLDMEMVVMIVVHARPRLLFSCLLKPLVLEKWRTAIVNAAFTMAGWRKARGPAMEPP